MDSLLVISDEPALHETLASELAEAKIEHARFAQSAYLSDIGRHRIVVIDEGGPLPADPGKAAVIRLTRPVSLRALLYTIRDRLQGKSVSAPESLALTEGLRLFPAERLLRAQGNGAETGLTEKETDLLQCLLLAGGEAIPRDRLLKKVWGYSEDVSTHTLETHIYRLRGKLRQTGQPLDIVFSDEVGYALKLPEE